LSKRSLAVAKSMHLPLPGTWVQTSAPTWCYSFTLFFAILLLERKTPETRVVFGYFSFFFATLARTKIQHNHTKVSEPSAHLHAPKYNSHTTRHEIFSQVSTSNTKVSSLNTQDQSLNIHDKHEILEHRNLASE
jgi:hypothetical protein